LSLRLTSSSEDILTNISVPLKLKCAKYSSPNNSDKKIDTSKASLTGVLETVRDSGLIPKVTSCSFPAAYSFARSIFALIASILSCFLC